MSGQLRIDRVVTSGTFSLDGGTWDVDNNVWVIGDDSEVNGTPDLPRAENYGTSLHGRYITGALYDTLHRRRDDQFTDCHVSHPLQDWSGHSPQPRL